MTSLNTSSSTVWFLPAAGDILSQPGPIGRERASRLGVLCWSLNFGALKNSWGNSAESPQSGEKLPNYPPDPTFWPLLKSLRGGSFVAPPEPGNYGLLPRSGK